ncbi:MAG TPA: hypothetical protein VG796_02155 [Verrucomicrobiales bacterium]|jgi:hypothetical protein|nr:hypothetical protein [Verrucomicrobiales bacterium]
MKRRRRPLSILIPHSLGALLAGLVLLPACSRNDPSPEMITAGGRIATLALTELTDTEAVIDGKRLSWDEAAALVKSTLSSGAASVTFNDEQLADSEETDRRMAKFLIRTGAMYYPRRQPPKKGAESPGKPQ